MENALSHVAQSSYPGVQTLVVVAVICALFVLPFYGMTLKNSKSRRETDRLREENLLRVISENSHTIARNTQVIEGLKDTFEKSGEVQQASLERIHSRIDKLADFSIKVQSLLTALSKGVVGDSVRVD
jgi:hypothetical protein